MDPTEQTMVTFLLATSLCLMITGLVVSLLEKRPARRLRQLRRQYRRETRTAGRRTYSQWWVMAQAQAALDDDAAAHTP